MSTKRIPSPPSFDINELTFINRNAVTGSKVIAHCYAILHFADDDVDDTPRRLFYSVIFKRSPPPSDITNDSIIDDLIRYINAIDLVSVRSKWLAHIHAMYDNLDDLIDLDQSSLNPFDPALIERLVRDTHVHSFGIAYNDLGLRNRTPLQPTFIWSMHAICSNFTGNIVEEMIAHALGIEPTPHDMSQCLTDSDIRLDEIIDNLRQYFITSDVDIHLEGDDIYVEPQHDRDGNRCEYHNGQCRHLTINDFKSHMHCYIFLAWMTYSKKDLDPSIFESMLRIINFVESNPRRCNTFIATLRSSRMISSLRDEGGVRHGIESKWNGRRCITDITTDDSIIEIKCCVDDRVNEWGEQLEMYRNCLMNDGCKGVGKVTKLRFINLYTMKFATLTSGLLVSNENSESSCVEWRS